MSIQSLLEKRDKLLFDARAITAGAEVTAEQLANVDTMLADANTLKTQVERLVQLDALDAENRSIPGRVPQSDPTGAIDPNVETRSFDQLRKATNESLRNYLRGQQFDKRALTVLADSSVMVPVGVTDPKIARKSAGSVYDIVYKFRSSTGESVKVPLLNDLANGFVLNSTAITTTDPGVGGITIQVDDIRSNPILIDNSLLADVDFDLVSFVEQSTQNRYQRTAAQWITSGNGSNVGALATGYTGITGATTATLGYKDFTGLLAALDPAYNIGANFLMSPATLANNVLNIVDSQNRPLFLPFSDGGISGFAGTLFGYPVKLNPYQPAVATGNVAVQFGNFAEGYTFREVLPGIVLKKSTDRWIELNQTGFVAFARVGGAVTNSGTVTAGTTQPVVSLTIK